MKTLFSGGCVLLLLAVSMVCLSGCEEDPDTDGVGSYFDRNPVGIDNGPRDDDADMTVSPSSATLTGDGETVRLAVEGGRSPYTWAVNDISKGSIIEVGTAAAVYQRASAGDNVVICVGAGGETAFSQVDQP